MTITNRFTGAPIFEGVFQTVKEAVEAAIAKGVSLCGAILRGADLSGCCFDFADFESVDFREANLANCVFFHCDFSDCDFAEAKFSDSDFTGCDFSYADLAAAKFFKTYLFGADFTGSNLSGCDLSGSKFSEKIDAMENIKALIYEKVTQGGGLLDMDFLHASETTNCLAGWAVVIHPQGYKLAKKYGTNAAAALIFNAAGINPIPNFYSSNEEAMEWLKDGNKKKRLKNGKKNC